VSDVNDLLAGPDDAVAEGPGGHLAGSSERDEIRETWLRERRAARVSKERIPTP
jgi:hypothetical protein